jgi:hydrogenase maturation protease
MSPRVAIIACGNPNRSDDGAGQEVLRLLRGTLTEHGEEISMLDAGTDGMGVMFAARGCRSLIVVDACRTGAEAGAIFEVPGSELEQPPKDSFNLHDFRWDHALFAGRRMFGSAFPADVTVFLIEAESVDFGLELSPRVAAAAERVAARIRELVKSRCPVAELVS